LLAKPSDDGAAKLWTAATQFQITPIPGLLNLKLSTSVSGIGQCEQHHKNTQQHRFKYSNRKLAGTTAAYCEIKMTKTTKRQNADKAMKSYKNYNYLEFSQDFSRENYCVFSLEFSRLFAGRAQGLS
jgi:hypothetical protein